MDDPPMSEVILGGCVPLTPCLPPQVQPCLRRAVPNLETWTRWSGVCLMLGPYKMATDG